MRFAAREGAALPLRFFSCFLYSTCIKQRITYRASWLSAEPRSAGFRPGELVRRALETEVMN